MFHMFLDNVFACVPLTEQESMLSTLTGVVENSWVAPSSYLTFPAKANTVFSHRSQSLHSGENDSMMQLSSISV